MGTPENEGGNKFETEVPDVRFPADASQIELANRRSDSGVPFRDEAQSRFRGKLSVIGVHVVFNVVDCAGLIVERSAMSGANAVRMKVRHEHVSSWLQTRHNSR
jgi:hypothetical protein